MKHFQPSEFTCKCGCGGNKMQSAFLEVLDKARELAGVPFKINSGYRCEKHNRAVGSTSKNHTSGCASDISCTDGLSRFKIVKALIDAGFKRIGVAKTFIHADCVEGSPASIWFY